MMALAWRDSESVSPPGPPCFCRKGNYPADDPYGRRWWWQVTSSCRVHWPVMDWGQKIRILYDEGFRFGEETTMGGGA